MEFAAAGFHLQHLFQKESSDQCITPATPQEHNPSSGQSWIPSNIYNNGFLTESFTNSREVGGHKYAMIDSLRISTEQAFGFHDEKNLTQHPPNDLLLPRIKGESEIMQSSSSSKAMDESREPQWSPSFFSSRHVTGTEYLPVEGGMTINFGGVSSISNLPTPDMTSSLVSCSLGLNPQMLNLHTSYSGSCGLQLRYDTFGLNEETMSLSHGNMQHAHGRKSSPSNSSNKISSFASEVTMTKRPSNCSRPKECEAKAKNKKSRPSCPPLKVRKEKLGDRIQTLQRLVAPFGKTSTACVLSEAIGYIHFLHEQIQTLSIPYMKSVQSKPPRTVQLDSRKLDSREFNPDLRSRGLCLMPVSYASFIDRCA